MQVDGETSQREVPKALRDIQLELSELGKALDQYQCSAHPTAVSSLNDVQAHLKSIEMQQDHLVRAVQHLTEAVNTITKKLLVNEENQVTRQPKTAPAVLRSRPSVMLGKSTETKFGERCLRSTDRIRAAMRSAGFLKNPLAVSYDRNFLDRRFNYNEIPYANQENRHSRSHSFSHFANESTVLDDLKDNEARHQYQTEDKKELFLSRLTALKSLVMDARNGVI